MQLHWQPAFSTSTFHAAHALLAGWPLVDADRLIPVLRDPATALSAEIEAAGLPVELFWRHLLGLSASLASNRELSTAVLRKCIGTNDSRYAHLQPRLEARIDALERSMQQAFPRLTEELTLRIGPLKEQWEARGPGLFYTLKQLLEPELLVEEATVLLVQPVLGGGGGAHLQYNAVRIEALLANASPSLPEPIRLAWLLAQLNCDLPRYADQVHADRLDKVAALALLPAVLEAAREVEWVGDQPDLMVQAIAQWRIYSPDRGPGRSSELDRSPAEVEKLAGIVQQWWQTFLTMRPGWNVALAALDRMLSQAASSPTELDEPR